MGPGVLGVLGLKLGLSLVTFGLSVGKCYLFATELVQWDLTLAAWTFFVLVVGQVLVEVVVNVSLVKAL